MSTAILVPDLASIPPLDCSVDGLPPDPEDQKSGPVVTFSDWDYAQVLRVGRGRTEANVGTENTGSYDQPELLQDESVAGPAAAAGEAAVAVYLGLRWTAGVWPNKEHSDFAHLPDVYPNIEVRRVVKRGNFGAIKKKDVGRNQILVVTHPRPDAFRQVEILGWLTCDEAWAIGRKMHYGNFAINRGVPPYELRHIDTIGDALKIRR